MKVLKVGKVENKITSEDERYGFIERTETLTKRLDLNDLIKRAKDEEKRDKKKNILILSGATAVALLALVTISLY